MQPSTPSKHARRFSALSSPGSPSTPPSRYVLAQEDTPTKSPVLGPGPETGDPDERHDGSSSNGSFNDESMLEILDNDEDEEMMMDDGDEEEGDPLVPRGRKRRRRWWDEDEDKEERGLLEVGRGRVKREISRRSSSHPWCSLTRWRYSRCSPCCPTTFCPPAWCSSSHSYACLRYSRPALTLSSFTSHGELHPVNHT